MFPEDFYFSVWWTFWFGFISVWLLTAILMLTIWKMRKESVPVKRTEVKKKKSEPVQKTPLQKLVQQQEPVKAESKPLDKGKKKEEKKKPQLEEDKPRWLRDDDEK